MIIHGDCLTELQAMPPMSVDLVFCSPPYEAARTYGIDYKLRGQDWVDWCVARYMECVRVCKGLVAWVVEGQTRQFRYSATPALFMADLHRAGVKLRKPPIFKRVGIPGSGGPDWLRNDWEWIVCSSHGKLPWSDNVALGKPPKWAPGGEMSYRTFDGSRVNFPKKTMAELMADRGGNRRNTNGVRQKMGKKADHLATMRRANGRMEIQGYAAPTLANPGNVLEYIVGGGGVMGSELCHENEAPFPEGLAEFFIRSFCPEGGTVLDPFCGSGTTLAVAERWGRKWIGIDVRQSQVELSMRRVKEVAKPLLKEPVS